MSDYCNIFSCYGCNWRPSLRVSTHRLGTAGSRAETRASQFQHFQKKPKGNKTTRAATNDHRRYR